MKPDTCAICGESRGPDVDYMCRCARTEPMDGEGPQGEEWLEACAARDDY